MTAIKCRWNGPDHEWPEDWVFGGPYKNDPRADPRWRPTTYFYYDEKFAQVFVTQVPMCDEQALSYFDVIWDSTTTRPVYIAAQRPDEPKEKMLPWRYEQGSHEVFPIKGN